MIKNFCSVFPGWILQADFYQTCEGFIFAANFWLSFCRLMVAGAWITTLVLASPQAIIFRSNHYLKLTRLVYSEYKLFTKCQDAILMIWFRVLKHPERDFYQVTIKKTSIHVYRCFKNITASLKLQLPFLWRQVYLFLEAENHSARIWWLTQLFWVTIKSKNKSVRMVGEESSLKMPIGFERRSFKKVHSLPAMWW